MATTDINTDMNRLEQWDGVPSRPNRGWYVPQQEGKEV